MSRSIGLDQAVTDYLARVNPPEHPELSRCREETERDLGGKSVMQISPEQGAVMALLLRLVKARRIVEVGVFTGYSSLVMALAMKDMGAKDARLFACDLSADYLARAAGYWEGAGVANLIEPLAGPAAESLAALIAREGAGTVDLAFIDADKTGYGTYYEHCLTLLRPGGLILFDNVLWSGSVADPDKTDEDTEALRAIADKARDDPRVDSALAAIGDGLLICVKR